MKKLGLIIASGLLAGMAAQSRYYSTLFKVTEIASDEGHPYAAMTDCNGNTFTYWLDDMDIEVGDYYSAVMEDCGKRNWIYDDEIVSIRYERVDLLEEQ